MPDNHYNPISDNTHTLQHYLNNTNKYFTSNTQLHFLPGQYYYKNDLIIQGVSNFSLVGNRTNEVINTVINCTLPAGVVVVDGSNIVIANIVMNECGNNYTSFVFNIFQNLGKHINSLFVFNSASVSITYFYSLWHKRLCGIELVNALESKLSNVVSTYLLIWYNGNDISMINTTDTLFIDKLQIYNAIYDIYVIQIKWNVTSFNFQAIILNVNFTNDLALYVTCIECLGYNTITVTNCSFHDTGIRETIFDNIYDNHGDYDDCEDCGNFDYNEFIHTCYNAHNCMEKIMVQYHFTNPERDKTVNNLVFLNCHFINNHKVYKVLHIIVVYNREVHINVQSVEMDSCLFYNNNFTQLLSVQCDDSRKYCISLLIKNTTISSNFHDYDDLIYVYYVILTFESVTIVNNTIICSYIGINIINAWKSYVQFNKYNEISKKLCKFCNRGTSNTHY